MVGYLTGRLGVSHRDVTEAIAVLRLMISTGSVCAIQPQISHVLAAPVEKAHHSVRQQVSQYIDGTGGPEGERRNARTTAWRLPRRRSP